MAAVVRYLVFDVESVADSEQEIIAETKQWLEQNAESAAAYRIYLERWGN